MNRSKDIFIGLVFFFFCTPFCLASTLTREQTMQREMDCIGQRMKSATNVDWSDVCYTSPLQVHQQEVDKTLDTYESSQTITTVDDQAALPAISSENETSQKTSISQEYVPISKVVKNFIRKVHELEIGTEISHIVYKEPIFNLKNRGNMYGAYGVYTYRPREDILFGNEIVNMYRIDGKISFGQMNYSSTSGTISGIDDYLLELRGVIGYDFAFAEDWLITPYGGIGYRRLSDDSSGKTTSTGAAGYGRVANYIYMPFGLEMAHQLDKVWKIGATGEFDVFLWGRQDSYLSDVDSSLPDLHNRQKRGIGLRGSLEIVRTGEKYNFLLQPFVRYWHLNDSDLNTAVGPTGLAISGLEPNNHSTELGIKAGVQF